jgi:DNA modification methylase
MAKKSAEVGSSRCDDRTAQRAVPTKLKPSSLLDTRVVYCGDNLEQLGPCRTGHHWDETKEMRAFEDRHENTKAYIDYMRPRCVQLARILKKTGSFYYHCDWHASHYVKVMFDQIFGENNFQNTLVPASQLC